MSTLTAIRGQNPMDSLEHLAVQIDAIRAMLGHSLDDQIGLISLDSIAESYEITRASVASAITRAGQPTVEICNRTFVRKPCWLATLQAMEAKNLRK